MTAGQVSGLIEGADCYYIIRLDSEFDADATEKKKEVSSVTVRISFIRMYGWIQRRCEEQS